MDDEERLRADLETLKGITERLLGSIHTNPWLHRRLRRLGDQELWERVRFLALFGMNAASGGNLAESGEEVVFQVLAHLPAPTPYLVVDVGANAGDYTDLACRMMGDRATVIAFEPLPGNYTVLQDRHGTNPRVRLVNAAVSHTAGEQPFYVDGDRSTIGSLVQRRLEHESISMEARAVVQVVTIDGFCRAEGISRIDLLKIDVEGADFDVLLGSREIMERGAVNLIQFELSSANIDARRFFKDYFGLLFSRYRLFRIAADGIVEIHGYHENYEIFWCINYLAVRRGCGL